MKKLGFPSMKSLDQFKSLARSDPGTSKSFSPGTSKSFSPGTSKSFSLSSRPASDSISLGSFANLKLTAGLIRRFWLFGSFSPKIVNIHYVTCVVDLFCLQRNWRKSKLLLRVIWKWRYDNLCVRVLVNCVCV
jgi:hypothetical protein